MDCICNIRSHLVWPCAPLPRLLPSHGPGLSVPHSKAHLLLWCPEHASLHLPGDLAWPVLQLAFPWSSPLAAACCSDLRGKHHLIRAFPDPPSPTLPHTQHITLLSLSAKHPSLFNISLASTFVSFLLRMFPSEKCPSYSPLRKLPQSHPLQLLIVI